MTSDIDELVAALEFARAQVVKKLAGVSEANARRSPVGSGTNLAGLLQHLTFVESMWFGEVVAGAKATRGRRTMAVAEGVSLTQLRADYKAACDESNRVIARIGDPDSFVMRNKKRMTLRTVILGVIQETAQHTGHADIIRELLDGKTGRS